MSFRFTFVAFVLTFFFFFFSTANWEQIYQKKTPIEHVLLRPDTYVGSLEAQSQSRWVASAAGKIELKDAFYVPGLYKVFDEVLVNACDNYQRDKSQSKIDVVVDVESSVISVFNDGRTIPVVMHRQEGVYVPELVFGHLLTGSNFDDAVAKATGGRNGYGAKLANIFSKLFRVEIWDTEHGLYYKQEWSKNMSSVTKPVIETWKGTVGGTKVTFFPDLPRFGMADARLDSNDILHVMRTRCFDVAACNPALEVTFNKELLPRSFEDFFRLFDLNTLGSVFQKMPSGWQVGVGVIEASSSTHHVSFVNSINTLRGGTHVNYILDQLCKGVAAAMKKDSSLPEVAPSFIKSHLILFVNCLVPNPAFDSQTKEALTTRTESIKELLEIPDSFVKKVRRSFHVRRAFCMMYFCSMGMEKFQVTILKNRYF